MKQRRELSSFASGIQLSDVANTEIKLEIQYAHYEKTYLPWCVASHIVVKSIQTFFWSLVDVKKTMYILNAYFTFLIAYSKLYS